MCAYNKDWLDGLTMFYDPARDNRQGNLVARELFEKARDAVENFALAYAKLSYTYLREWENDWGDWFDNTDPQIRSDKRNIALMKALQNARKAVELGAECHWNLAMVYTRLGLFDDAEREYKIAEALQPGNHHLLAEKGDFLVQVGLHKQAIVQIQEAITLVQSATNQIPLPDGTVPWWYHWSLARAYYMDEQYYSALAQIAKIGQPPPYEVSILKAICLKRTGQDPKPEMDYFIDNEASWTIKDFTALRMEIREGQGALAEGA